MIQEILLSTQRDHFDNIFPRLCIQLASLNAGVGKGMQSYMGHIARCASGNAPHEAGERALR